ncbi:hypothetical protein [Pediococcus acidilactici]|uniref:hypothetical protein n=1 Tax=Pediococcus acidilactici TaxID=1254 RepID=UPI000FFE29ED|nr:hypothetical protein [Pediococcus acidilactici]QAT20861.1 hypothetical protein EQZ51_05000 [Pediococcus acidilactici]
MLKNIKKNIVIPSTIKMNLDMDPESAVLAWSGYVIVIHSIKHTEEKGISPKFNLIARTV